MECDYLGAHRLVVGGTYLTRFNRACHLGRVVSKLLSAEEAVKEGVWGGGGGRARRRSRRSCEFPQPPSSGFSMFPGSDCSLPLAMERRAWLTAALVQVDKARGSAFLLRVLKALQVQDAPEAASLRSIG